MARYVIDAPTLLHVVDHELGLDPAHRLVAPSSLRSDAMELLLADVRAERRREKAALQVHERMTGIKIRLLGDRVSRTTAWKLAREHGWESLRDAEYVAITRLQADALVSVDDAFVERARDLVDVVPLEALLM